MTYPLFSHFCSSSLSVIVPTKLISEIWKHSDITKKKSDGSRKEKRENLLPNLSKRWYNVILSSRNDDQNKNKTQVIMSQNYPYEAGVVLLRSKHLSSPFKYVRPRETVPSL